MDFLERFRRGWTIGLSALRVASREPKLMVLAALPLVSLVTLIYLAFYGPLTRIWTWALMSGGTSAALALLVLGYFLLWFVMALCNTILIAATLDYLENGKVSLSTAFALAFRRLPQILAWSLFAATVGLLLSFVSSLLKSVLEGFGELFGSVLGGLIEASWAIATYFVAPVLIIEGVGPIAAARRSVQVLKQAWGESLGSGVGLSLLWLLLLVVPVSMMVSLGAVFGLSPATDMPLLVGAMLYAMIVAMLLSVAAAVQCSALFIYAVTGQPPSGFDGHAMAGAFRR